MNQSSDLSEELTKAAMWGNLKLLESLLEAGADPNFPNERGDSPLHEVAYYGEIECASCLLNFKADVNRPGNMGKTPLHKAVSGVLGQAPQSRQENEEKIKDTQMSIVKLLVSHGADLKITDHTGFTPRELAMQCDFYECADLIDELALVQQKQEEARIRENRITGLFSACEAGKLELVKEILTHIPDAINDFVHQDENLLMCAARTGRLHIVEYLLSQRAVAVASRNSNKTALHLACAGGHCEVALCLLNRLPALLMIDDSPGETSLHIAARLGHTNIVRNLIAVASRAQQIRSRENSFNEEAYLYSADSSRVVMNESLPEMTLDVMAVSDQEKRTPLHEAAANGHLECVKIILDYLSQYQKPAVSPQNSQQTIPSSKGFSPHSKSGPTQRKATPCIPGIDMVTLKGRTAFHEAAKGGYFDVMKTLLEAGADINAHMRLSIDTNINVDLNALVQACLMEKIDIVHFLLQHGATDARLKALKRTLTIPNNKIAGLLLCYNGGVKEIPEPRRSPKSKQPTPRQEKLTCLEIVWKSKNLRYICSDWFNLVPELPSLQNKYPVISQVDVSSNSLSELPIEVFKLPQLKQLDVSRNQITVLPVEERNKNGGWTCPLLSQLDINTNQITSLPNCIFSLPELKELNVNDNKIVFVSLVVWTAPKLQRIFLARNQLTRFPSERKLSNSSPTDFSPLETLPEDATDLDHAASSLNSVGKHGSTDSDHDMGSVFRPYNSSTPLTKNRTLSEQRETMKTETVISRRLESFQDMNIEVEELDDLDPPDDEEEGTGFGLLTLDLTDNKLVTIPAGLSCLAPKLQKLKVAKNSIKSLGCISDYPSEIELLDVSNNELNSSIAPAPSGSDYRSCTPCSRKPFTGAQQADSTTTSFSYKPCSHRAHKNLKKLTTVKLNNNQLYDLQLFKMIGRKNKGSELLSSFEDSVLDQKSRSSTTVDKTKLLLSHSSPTKSPSPIADSMSKSMISSASGFTRSNTVGNKRDILSKNSSTADSGISSPLDTGKSTESNQSSGSKDGAGSSTTASQSVVISPLFPLLSTLEVAHNRLRYVPSYIHHISNLSCLIISHNADIDTLPLELCNCEHLFILEYEGCPLTNPPAVDLNKFKLASDKLLYMKSLLHDAKPNESMKLMLVGLQKMGKTTLLSRLRDVNEEATPYTTFTQRITGEEPLTASTTKRLPTKRKEPLSTVGVDLGIWKYRKDLEPEFLKNKKRGSKQLRTVTFYTWDFGGQEEYYVTHQCFLSARSLYLVVWNITAGERGVNQLGPWLHNIQARAPDSPVVIVGTHCDKLRGEDRDRKKAEMNHIIYEKYLVGRGPQLSREMGLPKILDVIYVGCPSVGRLEGVNDLRMALYDIAFSLTLPGKGYGAKMKLLEQPIPASFLSLEEKVRVLSVQCKKEETPPVLKEALFRESTKEVIANPRELNQAVTFLHENGIMLHYDTPALSHLYFVNPQWLCDMLAHIVTVPEVQNFIPRQDGPDAGILRTSVLSHVFKGNIFPQAYRKEYIELLGKFEVALYLDRHRLLVPSMLPKKPKYTLHAFKNAFPRPSLVRILSMSPDTSKLFSSWLISQGEQETGYDTMDANLRVESQLAAATHMSEELFRTGLMLRRFYFMTYVPSGFWPRLISRCLASNAFGEVLLRSLGYNQEEIRKAMDDVVSGVSSGALSLEWSYWKTGIELWYKGLSLLRVSELLPGGSFDGCKPSPSIFEQSATIPIEPAWDAKDLSFDLSGHWMPVEMTPTRGIEIIVPDTVCLALLQKEVADMQPLIQGTSKEAKDESHDQSPTYPQYESHWMSAELLALAADYIDTLLEDWYPGLGARDGNKNLESIPYVNRVVPCPFCVSRAECLPHMDDSEVCLSSMMAPSPTDTITELYAPTSNTPPIKRSSRRFSRSSRHSESRTKEHPVNAPSNPNCTTRKNSVDSPKSRRALFERKDSSGESDSPVPPLKKAPTPELKRRLSKESSSLADIHRVRRDSESDDILAFSTSNRLPKPRIGSEKGLEVASKFGFMIESCILASRQSGVLVCPSHPKYPLPVEHLAPDLVFADLPRQFILDPTCVDKGEYIDHGSFGDIYHGAVYPSRFATDDEGREVAIKIDRMDSKKYNAETATKAYIEVRTEVSILHRLHHANIIDFIGVVLQPLCFILEWAPNGNLSSLFKKYRKVDARISPMSLQSTALQVASGLAYLHEHKIVYYDLKSPNILVFQFPSPEESLAATQPLEYSQGEYYQPTEVFVKIADLGISRQLSPGGVKGFKGSPGFMAPEILKYVGLEACTEKVDVFSFGMFLFELIALHFPFEKQNLMGTQIEKLVIEGERPPLQNRELNSPILYLDVMRWCWQQDYRHRPSAQQLSEILPNPSIPCLVDAISLHNSSTVTCSCICTLPIEILPPGELGGADPGASYSTPHPHVGRGDLQEELWLCMYSEKGSEVRVIDFRGKASQSFPVCTSKVSCICAVNYCMWLGTEEGQLFILDAITKHTLLERTLAVLAHQGIFSIHHLLGDRQVLVTRKDGNILLFNEDILDCKIPDCSNFDNRVNSTLLPVRAVSKPPEKVPFLCTTLVANKNRKSIWCGTKHEMILIYNITATQIMFSNKKYNRPRYQVDEDEEVCSLVLTESRGVQYMWALTRPGNVLYCWSVTSEERLASLDMAILTTHNVTSLHSMGSELQLALSTGKILLATTEGTDIVATMELKGHAKDVYQLLSIGGRILPRHWLPSIIGRSNAIDYYRDLLDDKDVRSITSNMVGHQTRLLVSIGYGYLGLMDKLVEPLMSHRDRQENFVLLWATNR